jgi:hypothetical protein
MNARFQDLQHPRNPRNGELLRDHWTVLALLDELRQVMPAFMCQFVGDNGFNLTVGIDHAFGCVQHSPNDGSPPYLMATAPANADSDQREMAFLVGDTLTPIDGRYRLPFDTVMEIVADFVISGQRSANVSWREFAPSG